MVVCNGWLLRLPCSGDRISGGTPADCFRAGPALENAATHVVFWCSRCVVGGGRGGGGPDRCIEIAKRTEAAGGALLFCLPKPYETTREQGMSPVEPLGEYILPEFHRDRALTPKTDQAPSRFGSWNAPNSGGRFSTSFGKASTRNWTTSRTETTNAIRPWSSTTGT